MTLQRSRLPARSFLVLAAPALSFAGYLRTGRRKERRDGQEEKARPPGQGLASRGQRPRKCGPLPLDTLELEVGLRSYPAGLTRTVRQLTCPHRSIRRQLPWIWAWSSQPALRNKPAASTGSIPCLSRATQVASAKFWSITSWPWIRHVTTRINGIETRSGLQPGRSLDTDSQRRESRCFAGYHRGSIPANRYRHAHYRSFKNGICRLLDRQAVQGLLEYPLPNIRPRPCLRSCSNTIILGGVQRFAASGS